MQHYDYGYSWKPLVRNHDRICDPLRHELRGWEGTPYGAGQQCKGVAVDCVRFVCGVLDVMYGTKQDVPRLPQDMSMHDRPGALAAMKFICGLYPHVKHDRGSRIMFPGDVVVVGERGAGPGHALIVGPDPGTLWQAGSKEVHCTGISFAENVKVFRVYRLLHKNTWAR